MFNDEIGSILAKEKKPKKASLDDRLFDPEKMKKKAKTKKAKAKKKTIGDTMDEGFNALWDSHPLRK